jgi:multiple sugar transport system ATP-binding protein
VNLFVAEFIGSPAMNLVQAEIARSNGAAEVRFGEHRLSLDAGVLESRPALAGYVGRPVALGIRPEDLEDAALEGEAPEGRRLPAQVDIREDMGSEVFLHFTVDAAPVETQDVKEAAEAEAVEAAKEQARRQGSPFIARVDRVSRAHEGERVELAVDVSRLQFFDLETGRAIAGAA